ncbi:MAG: hypothetical protein AAF585_22970, partial [Verrucomicrobiota bacterium]
QKENTGLPVIREIPILGKALGSARDNSVREELLIFIQPHIIPGKRGLPPRDTNELEENRSSIMRESLEFAEPNLRYPSASVSPAE